MGKIDNVFVFADRAEALDDLCTGAADLGGPVTALVFDKDGENRARDCGADAIYQMGDGAPHPVEAYFETIYDRVAQERPNLVLIRGNARGKLIAGRLAAALGTSALVDALEVTCDGDRPGVRSIVYGGAAIRTLRACCTTTVITVGAGVFKARPAPKAFAGQTRAVAFIPPKTATRRLETRFKTGSDVDLSAAKKVIGVGRGFARQADLAMADELAALIDATVGCSRPLAEIEHWLPKARYIGVSGQMIKPDLYLALGISGQVQHMFGVSQAHTIVAVNKDKNAPIFQQADYGIVADLYTVLPALIERCRNR